MRYLIFLVLLLLLCGSLYSQSGLKYIRQIDSLGTVKRVTVQSTTFDKPENVLVLYNINYRVDANDNNIWDGYEIAQYYQDKRNIPAENIAAIRSSANTEISRAEFDTYYDTGKNIGIKQQVEEILQTHKDANGLPLRSKIKYIVLTKGIPHKIQYLNSSEYFSADYASVDASLALIFNGDYNIGWHFKNPYYNQDPQFKGEASFIPEFYGVPGSPRLSFLVTRLDGYSVKDVKEMIDRALRANGLSRTNTFILDGDQKTYDQMQNAALILNSHGANVYPDPWVDETEHITTLQDSVIAIVTHGVHAGLAASYISDLYDFKLADGAVFSSYESLNGASFSENQKVAQGQIADFIKIGGSGGVGNVYEPYVSNIASEAIFLPAYYSGYTFAEAAYMSLPRIDWTAIVVGDPLMRIGPEPQPQTSENWRVISIKPDILSFAHSTHSVARVVFNDEIDSLKLPHFFVQQTGDTLNSFVYKQSLYLWPRQPLPNGMQIRYTANEPVYSLKGDSLMLVQYARFITAPVGEQPLAPYIYEAYPAGIDIDINDDLLFIFSTAMKPETIFPILGTPQVEQSHHWIDNSILRVSHPPLQQGTNYSLYLDEHAKSLDDISLLQNFQLSFETSFNSIVYDIDNDGFPEYALNLNNSLIDGYEVYADSGGVSTIVYDVADIDNDNQNEFFIKLSQNNFPLYFWNPNAIPYTGYVDECVKVDDDEDGQTEYAFDFSGTGYFTHVYDPGEADPIRPINFVLLNSIPADGQNNVTAANNIKLFFSKPPFLSDLSENIISNPYNHISSIYTAKNGTEINVQFSEKFPENSNIIVILNQNIRSIDNAYLAHSYDISFHTSDGQASLPPRVTAFYPGDSLKISDNTPTVRFVFSRPMQTNFNDPVYSDTTNGTLWTHYWADNNILYLLPLQQLQGNKNYVFKISDDLTDQEGQHISGKTQFNFTANEITLDSNRPTILQVVPEPGQIINTRQNIRIIFSEWITSLQQQWMSIEPEQPYKWNSSGSNMFTFSADPGWRPQSDLNLQIDGFEVLDANFNNSYLGYVLNFYVLGDIVASDIDNDGTEEYVIDGNNNLSDGLEAYVDPGGIITKPLFSGDIDGDGLFDFIIADSTEKILLAWYPAVNDSGLTAFCEKISAKKYDVSVDMDDLVEFTVDTDSSTVKPAIPGIRSVEPADGSDYVALFTPLIIQFNTAMDAFSVVQSVHFSYKQSGNWTYSHLGSRLKFEPENGWLPGVIQTVSVVPLYKALNQQMGKDSLSFSFRISSNEQSQPGSLSWQFPVENDTVHLQSDYYFAFNQPVDTSATPEFVLLQNFNSISCNSMWLNDTLIRVEAPLGTTKGTALLMSTGIVKFLNSEPLNFNRTTQYYISDSLSLRLVRALFNENSVLPLSVELLLLFNQPLNPAFNNNIFFNKVENTNNFSVDIGLILNNNLLTIIPFKLDYSSEYQLKLAAALKGVSGNTLDYEKIFTLYTETAFMPEIYEIDWQQIGDYLILNWPLQDTGNNIFELYLSEQFIANPDTVSNMNLYNRTDSPSWLFNLQHIPQQSFIYISVRHGNNVLWSRPLFINNGLYKAEDLVSLPLLNNLIIDSLRQHQTNLHTISQWLADIGSWNSTTYLNDIDLWSTELELLGNKGILGRTKNEGYIAWVQNLPESFLYNETREQQAQYHSLVNPYKNILAGDLARAFGNATRLAVWDNQQQGWNEAVYDSSNNYWLNNFPVHFIQPVYVYYGSGFEMLVQLTKAANSDGRIFPSQTKIFRNDIYSIQIYKNGFKRPCVVGCGVDSIIHAAYINIGNLDNENDWLFRFYDKYNRFVDEYRYGINSSSVDIKPVTFKLAAPYPNPFNSEITIPVAIPGKGKVDIKIFNVLGQLVHRVQAEVNEAQNYNYKWYGSGASGVYFIRVAFKNRTDFAKVLLIK